MNDAGRFIPRKGSVTGLLQLDKQLSIMPVRTPVVVDSNLWRNLRNKLYSEIV